MEQSKTTIHLGQSGEHYGNWMSNGVFFVFGGLLLLAIVAFALWHEGIVGIVLLLICIGLVMVLLWMGWVHRQYAFSGGQLMERVHQTVLEHLSYDGKGELLEVGCGSGALCIRAALMWPQASITGIDAWTPIYSYSQKMCQDNAKQVGVNDRCHFQKGDARHLDFPDESFDALISNYVYHNITGVEQQELLLESLRVLKKGGVFALHDEMKPHQYKDMQAFVQKLKDMGYQEVHLIDTTPALFGSHRKGQLLALGHSCLLTGIK